VTRGERAGTIAAWTAAPCLRATPRTPHPRSALSNASGRRPSPRAGVLWSVGEVAREGTSPAFFPLPRGPVGRGRTRGGARSRVRIWSLRISAAPPHPPASRAPSPHGRGKKRASFDPRKGEKRVHCGALDSETIKLSGAARKSSIVCLRFRRHSTPRQLDHDYFLWHCLSRPGK
jgi:hypothetical protein